MNNLTRKGSIFALTITAGGGIAAGVLLLLGLISAPFIGWLVLGVMAGLVLFFTGLLIYDYYKHPNTSLQPPVEDVKLSAPPKPTQETQDPIERIALGLNILNLASATLQGMEVLETNTAFQRQQAASIQGIGIYDKQTGAADAIADQIGQTDKDLRALGEIITLSLTKLPEKYRYKTRDPARWLAIRDTAARNLDKALTLVSSKILEKVKQGRNLSPTEITQMLAIAYELKAVIAHLDKAIKVGVSPKTATALGELRAYYKAKIEKVEALTDGLSAQAPHTQSKPGSNVLPTVHEQSIFAIKTSQTASAAQSPGTSTPPPISTTEDETDPTSLSSGNSHPA